jgi:hypothetical protein
MRIDELDEFQGITSEMIQAWLLATGWKQVEQMAYQLDAPPVRTGWLFRRGDETVGTGADISYVLAKLSRLSCKTPQALLREINPRMRKGMPSAAAIAAHEVSGGNWLAQSAQKGGVLRVLNWSISDHRAKLNTLDTTQKIPRDMVPDSWCFWPCDEHGNKVRWPTDADGKML